MEEEEKHLATDETNENMEKDKIIDNVNIISWYKCHFNCSDYEKSCVPWKIESTSVPGGNSARLRETNPTVAV